MPFTIGHIAASDYHGCHWFGYLGHSGATPIPTIRFLLLLCVLMLTIGLLSTTRQTSGATISLAVKITTSTSYYLFLTFVFAFRKGCRCRRRERQEVRLAGASDDFDDGEGLMGVAAGIAAGCSCCALVVLQPVLLLLSP